MLRKDGGINVLHIQGTEEEMARQHGELLSLEIQAGGIPFMARYLGLHLSSAPGLTAHLSLGVQKFIMDCLCKSLAIRMPRPYRRAFRTMAKEAGLAWHTADVALGAVDTMLLLTGYADGVIKRAGTLPLLRLAPALWGCCGAVALPEVTQKGHLLHARNMDYDGMGYMDRFPTVAFCRPKDGQPFAWMGSAGIHTAALTGYNASGLFLGSNTAPTTDVSVWGQPFYALNERVIREAKDIPQAIHLLSQKGAASGYNLHLSHGPSGQAVVAEYSYSRLKVREPQRGILVSTNHYCHPEMARTIPDVSPIDRSNTRGRYNRLESLLEGRRGDITLSYMVDCVRDTTDHVSGLTSPLGDVVCNYLNLTSVVADVTEGRFLMASGLAPSALGPYVSFDFFKEMEAFGKARSYPLEGVAASEKASSGATRCLMEYQRAHVEMVHRGDEAAAYHHLLQAREIYPQEARVALALALLSLKLGFPEAARLYGQQYLEQAPGGDSRRYRAHLVLSWSADLMGRATEARDHGAMARQESPGGEADLEIQAWTRRPFTPNDRSAMHVDLFNAKRLLV